MALSTMQEILILLEDEKEVPYFRLQRWGRPARGSLAKLKTLGWCEKKEIDNELYYQITTKGEQAIDEILSVLKPQKPWDKKWRLVMFDIPESERSVRDKLRRALTELRMGILQASVWISIEDLKNKIENIAKELNVENRIRFFEVSTNPALDRQIINKAWADEDSNVKFERFIKDAEWSLKQMGRGNGDQFKAKKLIFEYALISKNDPCLPTDFIEKNDLRKKAREVYQKLRRFAM